MGQEARARSPEWLVIQAQAGDRAALERLLCHTQELLRPYVSAMISEADLRDDTVQDILLLVYRKLSSLREPRAFAAWARRIASREIFRALRRTRQYERSHEPLPAEIATEPQMALHDGLLNRLPVLLARVSPASRAVLALHYLDGLTLDEIAAVLNLPGGTVKSRLAYGLAALRRLKGGG